MKESNNLFFFSVVTEEAKEAMQAETETRRNFVFRGRPLFCTGLEGELHFFLRSFALNI